MDKDTLVTLLKYKRWIDSETLKTFNMIDGSAYAEKRHLMLRLMNHIYVVDMIFKANMTGRQHGYTALNTPETPSVEELAVKMAEGTNGYIQQVKAMTSADLGETITFNFVDGGNGSKRPMEDVCQITVNPAMIVST